LRYFQATLGAFFLWSMGSLIMSLLPLGFVEEFTSLHSPTTSVSGSLRRSLNRADFLESGNIGKIVRINKYSYNLNLRSDNDQDLPKYWRQWWYTSVNNLPTDRPVKFRLKGRGHWNFYVPVFSYDNIRWQQFAERDVQKAKNNDLIFSQKFEKSKVYIARYYPYTFTKLKKYLDRNKSNPYLKIGSMGDSLQKRNIPTLTITDPDKTAKKSQIIVHARTHPGEVASSFLLEGSIDFLLSDHPEAKIARANHIFRIVPMLNVDGVVVGNNRVSPEGINLEGKWDTYPRSARLKFAEAPHEVKLFYNQILRWKRSGPPVSIAMNIHSSNGQPKDKTFFFPHFGPQSMGYSTAEVNLWNKQVSFIQKMKDVQGEEWFNRIPKHGTRAFLKRSVPESWWWKVSRGKTMALTIEATFGKAGDTNNWIRPNQIRIIGKSMVQAMGGVLEGY